MKKIDLTTAPINSSLILFSLPLILSFLMNIIYSWIDMYFVSRLGEMEVSALGVSEQLLFFIFAIGSGFGVGTGIMVARRIGERNYEKANHTAAQAIAFTVLSSIIIAFVLYLNIPTILSVMKIEGHVAELAHIYISILIFGVPANFFIFQINSIVRATGNGNFQFYILFLTIVLNIIFAPIFIFGVGFIPKMGVAGAGLATASAQYIGAIVAIIAVLFNTTQINLNFRKFKVDWNIIRTIVILGVPASLQLMVVSLNRIGITTIANQFGNEVLNTYILGLRIDLFVTMFIIATGAAIEVTTGQNLGANKLDRVYKYFKAALVQVSIIMVVLIILVFFFGKEFADIYSDNPVLIHNVDIYFKYTMCSYIPFALGIISLRVISGAGDYFRTLKIVVLANFIIQIPVAYLLSHYTSIGYEGIWLSFIITQIVFAILSFISLKNKKWLTVKV